MVFDANIFSCSILKLNHSKHIIIVISRRENVCKICTAQARCRAVSATHRPQSWLDSGDDSAPTTITYSTTEICIERIDYTVSLCAWESVKVRQWVVLSVSEVVDKSLDTSYILCDCIQYNSTTSSVTFLLCISSPNFTRT